MDLLSEASAFDIIRILAFLIIGVVSLISSVLDYRESRKEKGKDGIEDTE